MALRQMQESPFMLAEEIAERLGVHANTVYKLASEGQIPATRAGRRWRFRRGDVESWLANGGRTVSAESLSECDAERIAVRAAELVLQRLGLRLLGREEQP